MTRLRAGLDRDRQFLLLAGVAAMLMGILAAIFLGLGTWITLEIVAPGATCPPQLAGLLASVTGMMVGSLLTQKQGRHGGLTQHHESHGQAGESRPTDA